MTTSSSATETETAVKERPIIMSGEMIRAILAGRKSMTRRVVKPQPKLAKDGNFDWYDRMGGWKGAVAPNGGENSMVSSSPYHVGQRLWVRETFWLQTDLGLPSNEPQPIHYTADGNTQCLEDYIQKPSIFMPRAASRITLEVTGVRVERINRISLGDIEAEGTPEGLAMSQRNDGYARYQDFRVLWNTINQKRGYGWDKNPFVWCISFKVVQP